MYIYICMYTDIVISVLQYIYMCVGYHSDPYVKKETRLLQTRATNHVLDEVVCCLGLPHPAAEGLRTTVQSGEHMSLGRPETPNPGNPTP